MKTLLAAGIAAALCPAFAGVVASGGDTRILGSNEYAVHTFTNGGTFTVTQPGEVQVLLVGGGGGGGSASTGGGGGGGGGFSHHAQPGGKGGSGVVIIRCKVDPSGMAIFLQ